MAHLKLIDHFKDGVITNEVLYIMFRADTYRMLKNYEELQRSNIKKLVSAKASTSGNTTGNKTLGLLDTNYLKKLHLHFEPPREAEAKTCSQNDFQACSLSSATCKFPDDIWEKLLSASTKGLLFSFLCTLTEEYVTEILTKRHYSNNQIFWVNQCIRSLAMLVGGASLTKVIISPMASYLLIEYAGVEEATSNNITTGLVIGIDLVTATMDLPMKFAIYGTGIGCSFFGSAIAKKAIDYRNENNLNPTRG